MSILLTITTALGQVQLAGDPAIALAERLRGVEHEALHVDVVRALERRGVDPLAERGDRLVQPGRVDEHELGVRVG